MQPSLLKLWLSAIMMMSTTTTMMVHGAPVLSRAEGLQARQERTGEPTNLTTVKSSTTSMGVVTETCEIVLTPILVNGEPAFEEVRSCVITMDTSNNGGAGGAEGGGGQEAPPPGDGQGEQAPPAEGEGDQTPPAGGEGDQTPPAEGEGDQAPPADGGNQPLETFVISEVPMPGATGAPAGESTDPASPDATQSTPTEGGAEPLETFDVSEIPNPNGGAATTDGAPAPDATNTPAGDSTPADTSDSSSASAAAASEEPEAAGFEVPGKEMSVLPIGLGVFAGISVIALIVVGLVMYERTKYRKAFRQRKLAEQGSALGYGGMAQRA